MNYQTFLARWQHISNETRKVVDETERQLHHCKDPLLIAKNPTLPFNDLEWQAYTLNTAKLVGVKRLRGGPYASHPTRMAYFMAELLPESDSDRSDSIIYCLFHDYLEEGDGRNRPALMAFGKAFGSRIDAVQAAVLLSEPQIDYTEIIASSATRIKAKHLEIAAYVIQIEQALSHGRERALANTCIMDKIDNLHDLAYILKDPKLSAARVTARLCEKMAIVGFIEDRLGRYCEPKLLDILQSSIAHKKRELELPSATIEDIQSRVGQLYQDHHQLLWQKIVAYQQKIGLHSL